MFVGNLLIFMRRFMNRKGESRAWGRFYDRVGWDIALSAYQLLYAENKTDRISGGLIQVSFNLKLLLWPAGGSVLDVIVLFPVLGAIKRSRGPVIISGATYNFGDNSVNQTDIYESCYWTKRVFVSYPKLEGAFKLILFIAFLFNFYFSVLFKNSLQKQTEIF